MKDIALQYSHGVFYAFSEDDKKRCREFKERQIIRADLVGVKKPRSYQQLKLFWARCRIVADNTRDPDNWGTAEKVAEQIKVALQYVDMKRCIVRPDGSVHVAYRSISFKELPHMEACAFFERAWKIMAKHLGVPLNTFLQQYE